MGYFNWSPGSFSFGYRNDSPNRLIPSERDSEKHIYPSRGSFFLSYRFEIPQKIQSLLDFGYKDPLSLSVGLSSTPVSFNKYYQKNKEWQSKTSLSLGYAFSSNLSFNINPILYISEHSQESWDPDFTYCLDYTLPIDLKKGKVKLSYSNYGATRYPWKKAEQGAGSRLALREGSIGIIWILS
jgi:hypothetical protein